MHQQFLKHICTYLTVPNQLYSRLFWGEFLGAIRLVQYNNSQGHSVPIAITTLLTELEGTEQRSHRAPMDSRTREVALDAKRMNDYNR